MATLEKIRKKSTLLLVVVGVALLAFIIGDFFTSGRTLFGTGTTIAKVGDRKIDVQDFQRRNEEASQQMQQQQPNSKIDPAVMQAQVLQSMIQESLLDEEMNRLGITVTDAELSKAMTGANAHPCSLPARWEPRAPTRCMTMHSIPQNTIFRQKLPSSCSRCGLLRKTR